MKLVLDRFEGGRAVCQTPTGEMRELDKGLFPVEAREGDIFLWQEGGVTLLPGETARRKENLEKRFLRLFEKS
jgi:hypothetical protein